jgi:hypothetical protein
LAKEALFCDKVAVFRGFVFTDEGNNIFGKMAG